MCPLTQFQKFESTESTLDGFHFSVNPFQNWNQNPDKSNSHVLEKPKQIAKMNSQIWETKIRFVKLHRNHD